MTLALLAFVALFGQFGSADVGELRVFVADESGLAVPGQVTVASDANQVAKLVAAHGI